jgi:hypothetical protein
MAESYSVHLAEEAEEARNQMLHEQYGDIVEEAKQQEHEEMAESYRKHLAEEDKGTENQ